MTTRAEVERAQLERGVDSLLQASADLTQLLHALTPLERANVLGRLPSDVTERLRAHEPLATDDEAISRIHGRVLSMRPGGLAEVNSEDDPPVGLRRSELLSLLSAVHTLLWKQKTSQP